jgi:type II secretory pathway component PulC
MPLMKLVVRSGWVLGVSMILGGLGACAHPAKAPVATSKPAAARTEPTQEIAPPKPQAFVTSVSRAKVKAAIASGVGALLQHIALEDWPVMHEGKFHGFKIRAIDPALGVDLRKGDVVTRINGIVPEQPEDADSALRSLEKASLITIEFERENKAMKLELPIVD